MKFRHRTVTVILTAVLVTAVAIAAWEIWLISQKSSPGHWIPLTVVALLISMTVAGGITRTLRRRPR